MRCEDFRKRAAEFEREADGYAVHSGKVWRPRPYKLGEDPPGSELLDHIPEIIGAVVAGLVAGALLLAPLDAYAASCPYAGDMAQRVDCKADTTVTGKGETKPQVTELDGGREPKAHRTEKGA